MEMLQRQVGDPLKFEFELPSFQSSLIEMERLKSIGITFDEVAQTAKG